MNRSHPARISLIAILLLLAFSQSVAARIPAADLTLALLPESHEFVASEIAGHVPEYQVTATFTPAGAESARIEGTTRLHFVNYTNDVLYDIPFRLYPNAEFYPTDGMELTRVTVNGRPVTQMLSEDRSLALIPLGTVLGPGESVELEIDFFSTIPSNPNDDYSMFAFNSRSNSYNLGYWQPLLAGWTPEDGWTTGPILTRGDPVFTNIAFFSVELTAPSRIIFATTGVENGTVSDGDLTTYNWESGPVRDFVMIANPAFTVLETMVGETVVRSFTTPDKANAAQRALDLAANALEYFNERIGPYPYREFDMAQADLGPRAAGIEFPSLIYIADSLYNPDSFSLAFTIVHEVAHQYFYNLVGNNQHQHAFLDESLANYTSVLFFEERFGQEVGELAMERYLTRAYLATLYGADGDAVVDQPTADFVSDSAYGRIIYGKGAIGMHHIREAIGIDAFYAALAQYTNDHAFGVATPGDLRSAFETASGQDLQALWSHWFDEMHGLEDFTPDTIIELD